MAANKQPGPRTVAAKSDSSIGELDRARSAAARKHAIGTAGEEIWLEWRVERQSYCVAWYDRSSRSRRRKSLGIGPGPEIDPPREAIEALAAHYADRPKPATPKPPAAVGIALVLSSYLNEHCIGDLRDGRTAVSDAARQGHAAQSLLRFIEHGRKSALFDGAVTIDTLGRDWVKSFANFRRYEGVADATIKRELGVLRAAVNWAANDEIIASPPFIPKLQGRDSLKVRRSSLAYSLEQIAAILEAAWSHPRRHHVHLFAISMMASHARTEAILECNLDLQYHFGVIDWLVPGEEQTKKRRSMTPVGPTLAAWLNGRSGKLIRERWQRAQHSWADPSVPEFSERDVFSIKRSFDNCLISAGATHPSLGLRLPKLGPDGTQLSRIVRVRDGAGFRDTEEPLWEGLGCPNTFRHSIHTQLRRVDVPKPQIDAAAGHAEQGTGENYTHWDAKADLQRLTAGIEEIFNDLAKYTKVHLRSHCGPKFIDLGKRQGQKLS